MKMGDFPMNLYLKKISACFGVLLALTIIRLVDFMFLWNDLQPVVVADLLNEDSAEGQEQVLDYLCVDLGFSKYKSARKVLLENAERNKRQVTLVGYYNLLHPAVILIHNKGKEVSFSNQSLLKTLKPGITEFWISKFEMADLVEMDDKSSLIYAVLGDSTSHIRKDGRMYEMLYLSVTRSYSSFFFSIYFYVPFLILLIIMWIRPPSVLLGCFYFFEMGLFHGPKAMFWESNMFWGSIMGDLFKASIAPVLMISLVMLLLLYGCYHKFVKNKKVKLQLIDKAIILFFLLLPLFLSI